MKLSELYAHKAEYQEIYEAVCRKSEILPTLRDTEHELSHLLGRCSFYEKWRIDLSYYDDDELPAGCAIYTDVKEIDNIKFDSPTDLFVLWHPTGPFIFSYDSWNSNDYPKALFYKFWEEVRHACPPDYANPHSNAYYYKPDHAANAYEAHNAILEKYRKIYADDINRRKVERLKAEIVKLEEGGAE